MLLATLCVSCDSSAEQVCGPQVISEQIVLAPGRFVEAELDLEQDAQTAIEFTANGALAYDVHIHRGDDVINLVEGVGTEGTYDVVADEAGLYFPMWSNATDVPITLDATFELADDACWRWFSR